jgi:hypothetical protein
MVGTNSVSATNNAEGLALVVRQKSSSTLSLDISVHKAICKLAAHVGDNPLASIDAFGGILTNLMDQVITLALQ